MRKSEFYDVIPRARVKELLLDTRLPAFLYFTEVVGAKIDALYACLPRGFEVNYAFKANPNPTLLRYLGSRGVGADVASAGELRKAIDTGFSPGKVEFTGPGKTREELEMAIGSGVGALNAESLEEIRLAIGLARAMRRRVNLGVRVNPRLRPASAAMRMGGDTQFGIIEDDLGEAFALIRGAADCTSFAGYHFHLGSQMMRAEDVVANFESILASASSLSTLHGMRPPKINFGGGWGVDMFGKRDPLDLGVVRGGLEKLFGGGAADETTSGMRCVVEPGRFLVAECGLYAVPVLYKKRGYKRRFVVVDGGLHQHFAAAGGVGQGIRRNYECDCILREESAGDTEKFTVAGCLCLPEDILASDVDLPAVIAAGDALIFFNSGAYAYATSPLRFLSHPEPAERVL